MCNAFGMKQLVDCLRLHECSTPLLCVHTWVWVNLSREGPQTIICTACDFYCLQY